MYVARANRNVISKKLTGASKQSKAKTVKGSKGNYAQNHSSNRNMMNQSSNLKVITSHGTTTAP